ncbi:MAG TPA: Ig-like domain-containing protein, partial [Kofleriaceae bacterium]|nr:Ig-like domain-containing protein [Kofleriaceae bacterium]
MTNVDTNTAEDTPLTFTIPLTATKAGAVTLTIVTPPSHGALSGSGPTWTYTPTTNFNGEDNIVVRAED